MNSSFAAEQMRGFGEVQFCGTVIHASQAQVVSRTWCVRSEASEAETSNGDMKRLKLSVQLEPLLRADAAPIVRQSLLEADLLPGIDKLYVERQGFAVEALLNVGAAALPSAWQRQFRTTATSGRQSSHGKEASGAGRFERASSCGLANPARG